MLNLRSQAYGRAAGLARSSENVELERQDYATAIKTTLSGLSDILKKAADHLNAVEGTTTKVTCPKCGGTTFSIDEDAGDDARVVCVACGHDLGSKGEVGRATAEAATEKQIRDAFGQ